MRVITPEDIVKFLAELEERFPGFRLVTKSSESRHCNTWGTTVSVPWYWEQLSLQRQWVRLHHEAVHLAQFQRWGKVWLEMQYLWFAGRFRIEREAYAVQLRTEVQVFGSQYILDRRQHYIDIFAGARYWWCASRRAATTWVDTELAQVIAEDTAI